MKKKGSKVQKQSLGIRTKQWFVDFKNQIPLQMMVLPGIIFMIVFNYIPIYGLKIAF